VKDGWTSREVGEICQFSTGLWKGQRPPFARVGVIRNTNFNKDGGLDYSDVAYLDVEVAKLEKRRLRLGDIILEKSGGGPKQAVGRVALFDRASGDFSFSNFTASLRILDANEVDYRYLHKFLYWTYLSGATEGMQSHSTGIRNLDGDAYKAIRVAYPPVSEQRRLVDRIDDVLGAIETVRRNVLANLRRAEELLERRRSVILSARNPGWVESRLGDLCHISSRLVDPREDPYADLIHVGAGNIESGTGKLSGLMTARQEKLISGKFVFDQTMVLYSKIRPYLRKVARPDFTGVCSADIYPLSPLEGRMNRDYLFHLLMSREFTTYAMAGSARAGMPKVNREHLFDLGVWVPTVEQQARDAADLDALADAFTHHSSLCSRKLGLLREMKHAVLHEAFN